MAVVAVIDNSEAPATASVSKEKTRGVPLNQTLQRRRLGAMTLAVDHGAMGSTRAHSIGA